MTLNLVEDTIWDMGDGLHGIYPHGTDATDDELMHVGGRERWIQFKAVLVQ